MTSRKRSKNAAGSSSSQPAFDEGLFVSVAAFERYKLLKDKNVIQDRGMECNDDYRHEPQYAEVKRQIVDRGWQKFVDVPKRTNESLMKEFLANWPERDGDKVFIRRKWIPVNSVVINLIFNLEDFDDEEEPLWEEERQGIHWGRFSQVLGYPGYYIPDNRIMLRKELNAVAKAWNVFLSAHCLPTKNLARVEYYRLKYIYAIKKGYNVDVGKMIIRSLDHITAPYFAGGIGLSGVITEICAASGIAGKATDSYQISGTKLCPATLEKFSIGPRRQGEMVVRQEQPQAEHLDCGEEEEMPQAQQHEQEQPQQPVPPPHMPDAGYFDQHFTYLYQQNQYLMSAMQHQLRTQAQYQIDQQGLVDDINLMAARLNKDERVRRPASPQPFYMQPPRNPFQNDEEEDD
jgi:hypothetical protein